MHQYHLIDRKTGMRIATVCSSQRVEDRLPGDVINDAADVISYLGRHDEDFAARYELRYAGEIEDRRRGGWGFAQ